MIPRATENAVAGHIWPAGRYLPTPGVRDSNNANHVNLTQKAWKGRKISGNQDRIKILSKF